MNLQRNRRNTCPLGKWEPSNNTWRIMANFKKSKGVNMAYKW